MVSFVTASCDALEYCFGVVVLLETTGRICTAQTILYVPGSSNEISINYRYSTDRVTDDRLEYRIELSDLKNSFVPVPAWQEFH